MTEREIMEGVSRWINYVVHTRPTYEIEMAASALGIKGARLRSIAQSIINSGANALAELEER